MCMTHAQINRAHALFIAALKQQWPDPAVLCMVLTQHAEVERLRTLAHAQVAQESYEGGG
jgi:hypothetical protein